MILAWLVLPLGERKHNKEDARLSDCDVVRARSYRRESEVSASPSPCSLSLVGPTPTPELEFPRPSLLGRHPSTPSTETTTDGVTDSQCIECEVFRRQHIQTERLRNDTVGVTRGQDYKRFSSMSRCSTHNLCSEMT